MRAVIGLVVVFGFVFLIFAIYIFMSRWGSLEGDIVFEDARGVSEVPSTDMYVFLLSDQIEPLLDSLNVIYNTNVAPLEDTVAYLRRGVEDYTNRAREEEVIFRLTVGNADPSTSVYRENRAYFDRVAAERDSIELLFDEKRKRLIEQQSGYNGVVEKLFENKMLFKAQVDEKGHFLFKKVSNDDYFIYTLKIVSGDEDITRIPADMYYLYALRGETIRKYSWMVKVSVDEKTYIRLDGSNMAEIFK